jgi:hypothetical protein
VVDFDRLEGWQKSEIDRLERCFQVEVRDGKNRPSLTWKHGDRAVTKNVHPMGATKLNEYFTGGVSQESQNYSGLEDYPESGRAKESRVR